MLIFNTESEEELPVLAEELLRLTKNHRFILLNGDLGSGKTTLVRHLLSRLKVHDIVASPTFSMHNTYSANGLTVLHSDLYRIESADELEQTGFFELIEDADMAFIEWADKFNLKGMLERYAEINITTDATKRQYTVTLINGQANG